MAGPAAGGAAAGGAKAEEQTEFTVMLNGAGEKKIQVIKVVRELTSLGLKEAKTRRWRSGQGGRKGFSRQEADAAKAKLEEVGATVEVK